MIGLNSGPPANVILKIAYQSVIPYSVDLKDASISSSGWVMFKEKENNTNRPPKEVGVTIFL